MNAQKIKERFDNLVKNPEGIAPTSKARGVYVGALNRACKGDANRKLVLRYLTGKTSSKNLTDEQWAALRKMCDISSVELERICAVILGEVVKQNGQTEMVFSA